MCMDRIGIQRFRGSATSFSHSQTFYLDKIRLELSIWFIHTRYILNLTKIRGRLRGYTPQLWDRLADRGVACQEVR